MKPEDDPFYGDDRMRALQAARDGEVAGFRNRPGAVVHGRVTSSDDPDAFGWDDLRAAMRREGIVQIRGATPEVILKAEHELAGFAPKQHFWDVFLAAADRVRAACGQIVAGGLPDWSRRGRSFCVRRTALSPRPAMPRWFTTNIRGSPAWRSSD